MLEEEQTNHPRKETQAQPVRVGDIQTSKDGKIEAITNDYDRYDDFTELGEGGTATVLRCLDAHLGRTVALKQLHPHYMDDRILVKRFTREARVMAQLQHPNILPVHELGQDDKGNLYFTMKEVKGDTLHEALRGVDLEKPAYLKEYPFERLLDIFIQVCQAIAFAHTRGVVHRDLKPANILIGKFGEVLVLDWGLAKLVDSEEEENTISDANFVGMTQSELTTAGSISGTPVYMSPEQARGEVTIIDTPSDIYSLGSIMYQILTNDYCVSGTKVMEIIRNVVREEIVSPRKKAPKKRIPPELDAICMKALQKNPEDRYPSMREMIADLKNYRAGMPISVMTEAPLRRFGKCFRRHPVLGSLGQAIAGTALVSALLISFFTGQHEQSIISFAQEELKKGALLYEQQESKEMQRTQIVSGSTLPSKAGSKSSLIEDIDRLRKKVDQHYHAAAVLFLEADMSEEALQGLQQILNHRIAFAISRGEKEVVETALADARTWFGENFGKTNPQFARWLSQAEKELEKL